MILGEKYAPVHLDGTFRAIQSGKIRKHSVEYRQWWAVQKKRLKEGYKPTGGEWIPGNYYFYLNFSKIHGLAQGAKRKSMIRPLYRDQDHEYYLEVNSAKEGGYGIIVLKARRKGFSFMNANILLHEWTCFPHSENGIGAQTDKYVQDFRKKIMLSYNELPKELTNKVLHDNEEILMSGYKLKEDGVWKSKGMMSMIHFRIMEKVNAFRGTSLNFMVFEEAGEFLKLIRAYQSSEDCFKEGDIFFGTPIIGGTSNQMEVDSEDYMKMYYASEQYNLKPIFISSAKVFGSFFDFTTGKSSVTEATKHIEAEAEKRKKSGNIINYFSYLQENPLKVEHAFVRVGQTPFDLEKINKQLVNIRTNKSYQIAIRGRLDWQRNTEGKEVFGSQPEWVMSDGSYDGDNPEVELWPFEIVEHPLTDIKNAHVAAIDPYQINDELEELKKSKTTKESIEGSGTKSRGSMCVYRRFVNMNTPGEMPVAFYTDRPYSKETFYENCLKLAIYYNTQVLIEYNDEPLLQYFIKNKMSRYLKMRPKSADSPYSQATNKYGIHMKTHQKAMVTELVDEYVKRHWEDIYFSELLSEMTVYGKKNTDRVMAFGMALIFDQDETKKIVNRDEDDEKADIEMPSFTRRDDGSVFSIHRGIDGKLQKSVRNPTFDYGFDDEDDI